MVDGVKSVRKEEDSNIRVRNKRRDGMDKATVHAVDVHVVVDP